MIKNMTRKGLAIGATAALTLAGLVGFAAPAQATTVLLAPSVGTEYAVPLTETFILETRRGDNTNPFNDDMTVTVIDADQLLDTVGVSANADGSSATSIARGTGANVTKFEDDVTAPTVGDRNYIVLTPKSSATATFSVSVTVGFDGGAKSPERIVTFHKAADYTWNLSFTTPVVGDAKFGAVVSTTPQLNLAQFASKVKVGFATVATNGDLTDATAVSAVTSDTPARNFVNGTAASVTADVSRQADGSYKWAVNVADTDAPADKVKSTKTYVAQIVLGSAEVGTRQVIKPAADTITGLKAPALAASSNTKAANIRLGTTSVTVETVAYTSYTSATVNTVTPAGESVKVTITKGADFAANATVAAGGKTLTATSDPIEITATVGADGKVSIPLTLAGLVASDKFSVAVAAQNATVAGSGNLSTEFTVLATAATQMVDHNLIGTGAVWKVPHGTYTIRFAVVDNFDQPLVGTGYRVTLKNGNSPDDDVAQPVVNGVATFSVSTKNSDDENVASFTAQLEKADGLGWVTDGSTVVLNVNIGASTAASTVSVSDGTTTAAAGNSFTLPATGTFPLNLEALKSANTRLGEVAPTIGALGTALSGVVTDANGVGTYSNVTISAPGLMFAATAAVTGRVFSMDSITVQTSLTGAWAGVEVYSNKAGKVTVTVTAGGVSQNVVLTFAPAAQNTGTVLSVNVANAIPGSTMVVSGSLADKYGNPVKTSSDALRIVYTGPGFPAAGIPTATDAEGNFEFRVLLGTSDVIAGTVTVTYSPTASTLDDITVVTSLAATSATGARGWTRDQGDGTIKMYARDVVGAGKIQFFHNGREVAWIRAVDATDPKLNVVSDGMVRTRALVSGRNVFEIYVDGVRLVRRIATGS
jgi:hypothetical protein